MNKSGWGFIGASNIAREYMIATVRAQPDQDVVALASSDIGRAMTFAQAHNIDAAYESVHDLLADPAVDVVYVSTTNDLHCEKVIARMDRQAHALRKATGLIGRRAHDRG